MKKIPQDIVGNVALLKFKRHVPWIIKKLKAHKFLKENKNVTTVLEKTAGFSGELRTLSTKYLAGIKTTQATYKENNCIFKFDINESYFSPRLSNERKIIAEQVEKLCKKNKTTKILVMFAGISPYPITIAKRLYEKKKKALIISNELNEKANEESEKNIRINKVQDYVKLINGDARNLPKKIKELQAKRTKSTGRLNVKETLVPLRFDIILMPRPNLKDTFLQSALKLSKKGTTIFYHGFGTEKKVLEEIKKDTKNKIGKIQIRKAGDIGPYEFRWQAVFRVK